MNLLNAFFGKTIKGKEEEFVPTYLAIDFETANSNRISACAIGLAWLQGGEILRSEKHLIKPPAGEKFNPINVKIHGIRPEDVRDAPSFLELWNTTLADLFSNHVLVLHNASMDASIIQNCLDYYGLKDYYVTYFDTMKIAKTYGEVPQLTGLCKKYGIDFIDSHDPEGDAMACAKVFAFQLKSGVYISDLADSIIYKPTKAKTKSIDKQNPLTSYNDCLSIIGEFVLNDVSVVTFEGQTFVLTGELEMDRGYYQTKIEDRGGVVRSSVNGKTDFVVVGYEFGPSKVCKVKELNDLKGKNIQIITPNVFYKLMI